VLRCRGRHVFRQRSPIALAVVFGLCALLLLWSTVTTWDQRPAPLFLSWLLVALAVVWTVFVRPSVVLDERGIELRNVVRDVHVPWRCLTDVGARWNVRLWTTDREFTAWAISAQVNRPRGRRQDMLDQSAAPVTRVTISSVAQAIELAQQDYERAVSDGQLEPETDPKVRVTWSVPSLVMLVVPLLAVVVFTIV